MKRLAILVLTLFVFEIQAAEIEGVKANSVTSSANTQTTSQQPSSEAQKSKYPVPAKDKDNYIYLGISTKEDGLKTSMYIVRSSIELVGDTLKVKNLANYENPPVGTAGRKIVSLVADMQIDCKSINRYRFTNYEFFPQPFGEGSSLGEFNRLNSGTANWIPIPKGSALEAFAQHYCTKKSVKNSAEFLEELKAEEKRLAAAKSAGHTPNDRSYPSDRSYLAKLKAKIRANVILPPNIEGNPACVYRITQNPNGEIESVELKKSSGNRELDAAVKTGILRSSPLPIPDGQEASRIIDITYLPF